MVFEYSVNLAQHMLCEQPFRRTAWDDLGANVTVRLAIGLTFALGNFPSCLDSKCTDKEKACRNPW